MGSAGPPGYCDPNSCVGYNVGAPLPSDVFQNYGEPEEDDPYRYYQPNYPAPRPVAPDDPALTLDGALEPGSPGGQPRRRRRSAEWEEPEEPRVVGVQSQEAQ